jgi:CDP-diacylglycerol pyrophosphatase
MKVSSIFLRRAGLAVAAFGLVAAFGQLRSTAADPMALWNIVHGACVPHAEAKQGPGPCTDVDLGGGEDGGEALLKDLNGVAQELAIPTRRITGIEDPFILTPEAPNYFVYAWRERAALEALLKTSAPREAVGVSINSLYARSQNQLHLHVDCMDRQVAEDLAAHLGDIGETFKPLPFALKGRTYLARRVSEADLAAASPFQMLADGVEGARAQMGAWSLILVGATLDGAPGYLLLADHADPLGGGHAEALQDHNCLMVLSKGK